MCNCSLSPSSDTSGVMNLRLPSLMMLNLDWTCVTEASSLEYLNTAGTVAKQ